MVRNLTYTLLAAWLLVSCQSLSPERNYSSSLHEVEFSLLFPEEYSSLTGLGFELKVENARSNQIYKLVTDSHGTARCRLTDGVYNAVMSTVSGEVVLNASSARLKISEDQIIPLKVSVTRTGAIVIKEIYCGGCTKYPLEGKYNFDKYIIIHNNRAEPYDLDGLCVGMVEPYNSSGNNVWIKYDPQTGEAIYPEDVPVVECIWRFVSQSSPDYMLAPGEDAVIAVNGAIDHTEQYPNSVNLNCRDYFAMYNPVLYPNTSYHPVPGDQIDPSHYLEVVQKIGTSNAYPYSMNSPATVLFRAKDVELEEYISREGVIQSKPGSAVVKVFWIPKSWILDAVEIFNGAASNNVKRLDPGLDAGAVTLSATNLGHTLMRKVDEQKSSELGYTVLQDTDNSSEDFFERETQSLKDKQ